MSQLADIKVLELASVLAGPSAGQFFAELGADVIKVENLKSKGDVTRTWKSAGEQTDDCSAYFSAVNWGKKSIALDLLKPEGQEIIHRLTEQSDMVIASYKPGDAEKLNVDYDTLCKFNPAIIYGQITGYGNKNPRVGYDAIIQAEAGFMYMNGEPGGNSLKMPVALIDILAGHQLKEGLLLALLNKFKTGKGRLVEVSLIQSAVASLANQATNWLVAKKLPQKHGSAHPNIAPYGDVFITADDKELLLAVGNDRQFQTLCKILGIENLCTDTLFSDNVSRVSNRGALNRILQSRIQEFESETLIRLITDAKIPAGLIQNIQQVFEMPEVKALMIESSGLKGVKTYVANTDDAHSSHFLPPPHLGEHTHDILKKSLNYSSETIDTLRSTGVLQ
jgi:crotonobetainyl-CoA:carnitine CoA-transferase CaiB-like acyl-CoA transferase